MVAHDVQNWPGPGRTSPYGTNQVQLRTREHHPRTGEPWCTVNFHAPWSSRQKTFVAAMVPVAAPSTRFSSTVTQATSPWTAQGKAPKDEQTRRLQGSNTRFVSVRAVDRETQVNRLRYHASTNTRRGRQNWPARLTSSCNSHTWSVFFSNS